MEISTVLNHAKNCFNEIKNYEPPYPAEDNIPLSDHWSHYKNWVKNYADMSTLLFKVGPIKLVKGLIEYPWIYDLLKANCFYHRLIWGRSGNYREGVNAMYSMVLNVVIQRLEWLMNEPENLVLVEDLVPPEIIYAMGLKAFMPEMFGMLGTVIDQHASERYIDIAENAGTAPDACTLPKIVIGMCLAGHMPKACAVVTSNMPCDAGSTSYEIVSARGGNLPIYRLDIPHYFKDGFGLEAVVADIKEMITWLEANTPGRMDWNRLKEICEERNRATEYELALWELNRARPTAMPGEPVYLHHLCTAGMNPGSKEATASWKKVYELAKDNLEKGTPAFPNEKYRAFVWNPVPAMFSDIQVWAEQTWGLTFYIDSMSFNHVPLIDTTSPDTMLRDLAINIANGPMARHTRGPADANYFPDMWEIIERFDIDMIIMSGHVGCKNTQALLGVMREKCRERNIPLMVYEYDLMDPRVVSQDGIKAQVNHFMENVMKAERFESKI